MKRFVVITLDQGTKERRDAITEVVKQLGLGWWHWFQDSWMIPNVPAETTPKAIYAKLESVECLKLASIVVLAFDGVPDHWGRANPDSWKWLKDYGKPR